MPLGGSRRGVLIPGDLPPEKKFVSGSDAFMRTRDNWDWMYANGSGFMVLTRPNAVMEGINRVMDGPNWVVHSG